MRAKKLELVGRLKTLEEGISRDRSRRPQHVQFLLDRKHQIVDFLNQETSFKSKAHEVEFERLSREFIRRKLDLENIRKSLSDVQSEKRQM